MKRVIPGMLLVLVSVALVVGIGGWCGWFKVNPPGERVGAWYPKWLAAQQMAPANETEQGKVKDRLAPMERRLNDDVKGLIHRLEAVKVDASARLSGLEAQQGRAVIRNAKLRHDAERELLDWMNAKLRRMEGCSVLIHLDSPFFTASMTVESHALSWIATVIDRRYNAPHDGHRPPLQRSS